MVSRTHRLRNAADFRRVFARGRNLHVGPLTLRFAPNRLPASRFAVVVSTRVAKSAVVRNRLRRRCYEQIRRDLSLVVPGLDCIIRLAVPAATMPRPELSRALDVLLRRADVLRRPRTPSR
jgi:ribonuclease P protein component